MPATLPWRRYPLLLLVLFAAWWAAWGIDPVNVRNWWLENMMTFLGLAALLVSYRRFRLSNLSYTCIFVFLCLHVVGAHYTYSGVPYRQWLETLGVEAGGVAGRNHFDRLVHFCFGLLWAYPIRELFLRVAGVRGFWGYYLPLDVTMSFSMLYELIEWAVALAYGGAPDFLGTQGDPWDAQKDMALATLGATIAMAAVAGVRWRLDRRFGTEMRRSLSVRRADPLGEVALRKLRGQR